VVVMSANQSDQSLIRKIRVAPSKRLDGESIEKVGPKRQLKFSVKVVGQRIQM
jgi:hypothetical protein